MPEPISSVTDSLKTGNRVVALGIGAIVLILFGAAAATLGARRRFAKSKAKADTKADKAA